MKTYKAPTPTQMRSVVKDADHEDYYRRYRIPLLRIALLLIFLACVGFIFLFWLMEATK